MYAEHLCNMELSKWLPSFNLTRLPETSSQLPRWLFVRGILVYLVYYMFGSWRKYKVGVLIWCPDPLADIRSARKPLVINTAVYQWRNGSHINGH